MHPRPHESLPEKARHINILKNQYDLMKEELKYSQDKTDSLERDHIARLN